MFATLAQRTPRTKTSATDIVEASKRAPTAGTAAPGQVAQAEDILSPIDRAIVGEARVQYRLPLLDPVQVKRDLLVLRGAVDQALAIVDKPEKLDRTILLTVRGIIKRANDMANAKWRGKG